MCPLFQRRNRLSACTSREKCWRSPSSIHSWERSFYTLDQEDVAEPEDHPLNRQLLDLVTARRKLSEHSRPCGAIGLCRRQWPADSVQRFVSDRSIEPAGSALGRLVCHWYPWRAEHLGNTIFRDRRRPEDHDNRRHESHAILAGSFDRREYSRRIADIIALGGARASSGWNTISSAPEQASPRAGRHLRSRRGAQSRFGRASRTSLRKARQPVVSKRPANRW